MPIQWPTQLQEVMNSDGFTYNFGDTTIRSQMDIGPDKVRRRTTRPVDTLTCSIDLTMSQYSVFRTFFNTTLNGGVNQFDFLNPLTNTVESFRFTKPPVISAMGSVAFKVAMEWEKLP